MAYFSETAYYFSWHQAEMDLIPMGLEKGWPSEIDFENLHVPVYALVDHLWEVTKIDIPSYFRDITVKNWVILGFQKAQSVFHNKNSFEVEKPGYYGFKGFKIIYQTLRHIFMATTKIYDTTQLADPLMPDYFVLFHV
ncbi:uncharacterized protein VP01_2719g6 [Puccinia sorghi]|uniref:Restriction of telomere capping protein 4 C-terminal domain-containing protein n=1 Tax=Puccinia sorghi TaxID=27349 RepID=A0A0L6V3D9_9BASI|nr:uncharacterized protein VP01_2719g6 [Puccinia sorghi]